MIKVTVGEQKTQSEKPFPKLMICVDGSNRIVLATGVKTSEHEYEVLRISGFDLTQTNLGIEKRFFLFCEGHEFVDYNEPITIQNI